MHTNGPATRFHGIYASIVCPMQANGDICLPDLERHVADVAGCGGMAGLLVNGHAGENALLDRAESALVVRTARRVAPRALIVAGVNAESTRSAVDLATDAAAAGADAILAFAPYSWALGATRESIVAHHRAIHDATDLPLMLFQGSVHSGKLAFTPEVLEELVQLPRVVAIKEGGWETSAYEATRRLVERARPEVAVMASGDEHLLTCFVLGSEGSLVSLAAVAPELVVALDRAVRRGDMAAALACHERIYPLSRAIYGDTPAGMVTAKLKACLVLLGRISSGACKPPIGALPAAEIDALARALDAAGLRPPTAARARQAAPAAG